MTTTTPRQPRHLATAVLLRSRWFLWACLTVAFCHMVAAQPSTQVRPEVMATDLDHPWAVAFLPEGRFLVTERPGRMRVIEPDGRVHAPLGGVPAVAASGQGGLLDIALDSGFARNRLLYFCYAEPGDNGSSGTALARARLNEDLTSLQDVQVIFRQQPKVASRLHFGCRIAERQVGGKSDGTLFLTLGERFSQRDAAQRLDNHLGKVVRVGKDGSVPKDNPFIGRGGTLPEIWSHGHRNGQGAAIAPDGQFWMTEHGAMGGDEINLPRAGGNHGWPVVSFGVNYDGTPVGTGQSGAPGMQAPLHHWTPSIAPSGMAFLTSDRYGSGWQGGLFVGSLKFRYLARLTLRDGRVVGEERLLQNLKRRIRDVRQGPDGWLYVLTDEDKGQLLRILPAPMTK
ncbi:MAG: hypothetical protein BGO13_15875 [Burkholderiales bacterium 66-5]|nr:MAG: hypothetical protein BGO13_15875 [Burkholderiales bacterium 66-5]